MRKNRMMRLASALLILTMVTTCAISGTFAKYVTQDSGSDSARVAKWGVDVVVTADTAFADKYDAEDTTIHTIATTVIGLDGYDDGTDADQVLAPGTGGDLLKKATITGTPEVATRVTKTADLELTGWAVNNVYYCPLTIEVDGNTFYGMDDKYTSAGTADECIEAFETAVETALADTKEYDPNHTFTDSHTVTWKWAFEGTDGKQTNELDTALGNIAAASTKLEEDITIAFNYGITVEQLD